MAVIRFKRGTRAQLDTAAGASELLTGEPYFVTDEQVTAVGTSASTYVDTNIETIDAATFDVLTGTTNQTLWEENDTALLNARTTGWRTQPEITVNGANTAQVDVSAGTGQILDNTDPNNPTFAQITYAGSTAVALTDESLNYLYVDQAGALNVSTTAGTSAERRVRAYIGSARLNAGVVTGIAHEADLVQQSGQSLGDLVRALGVLRTGGLDVTPGGANLTLQVSAGGLFSLGVDPQNPLSPNEEAYAAKLPGFVFRMVKQDTGSIDVDETVLPVEFYDANGVITEIPGNIVNTDRSSVFTVYMFRSGNVRIAYGQDFYDSLEEAQSSIGARPFVTAPNFENAFVIGYIAARKAATDLTDPADAIFTPTNQFGGVGGGVTAAVVGALLASNNLSDLADAPTARTNLDVPSNPEMDAAIAALQAQATITVDAGSDGTTARPTGWGAVQWIKDNGVTLDNVGATDLVFERGV